MEDQIQESIFPLPAEGQTRTLAKTFMANVFLWMFVALGLSAIVAFAVALNMDTFIPYLLNPNGFKGLSFVGWLTLLAPIGFVMYMSSRFQSMSAPTMIGLFLAYAAINGITFSFVLLSYEPMSLLACFGSSAAMFGVMAVMGYTTDKDLTGFGRIMIMGLIGIVIASLINLFIGSDAMSYLISFIGVAVFTGLTAYDVQKLKRIGLGLEHEGASDADTRKLSIMGALSLYLDFINLFLSLLRIFGRRN